MSWVKRNIYFLVGGIVAVALLGLSGYYCFSQWRENQQKGQALAQAYQDWTGIINQTPNAGSPPRVDNIKLAREYLEMVKATNQIVQQEFVPIPPVPNSPRIYGEEFASALRTTLAALERDATSSGVTLPAEYAFTFEVQKVRISFDPSSLQALAEQLGDIKAICDVLFRAKVNSVDGLRRQPVSVDDQAGSLNDYLDPTRVSVTNDLAVISPYEVRFHCFSSELGATLAGFANSPHGMIVKSFNVEPGPVGTVAPGEVVAPTVVPTQPTQQPGMIGGYTKMGNEWVDMKTGETLMRPPVPQRPAPPPRTYVQPLAQGQPAVGSVALEEEQLLVTLDLRIVKLRPPNNN